MNSLQFALAASLLLGVAHGCTPLAEVLSGNTLLVEAVKAAGLLDTLTAPDSAFTIFAPSDDAFKQLLAVLDITTEEALADTDLLKQVLLYHVLGEAVMSADLSGTYTTLQSSGECDVTDLTVTGGVIEGALTTANVVSADIEACESSVVHQIDSVLVPCVPPSAGGTSSGSTSGSTSGSG